MSQVLVVARILGCLPKIPTPGTDTRFPAIQTNPNLAVAVKRIWRGHGHPKPADLEADWPDLIICMLPNGA